MVVRPARVLASAISAASGPAAPSSTVPDSRSSLGRTSAPAASEVGRQADDASGAWVETFGGVRAAVSLDQQVVGEEHGGAICRGDERRPIADDSDRRDLPGSAEARQGRRRVLPAERAAADSDVQPAARFDQLADRLRQLVEARDLARDSRAGG